MTGECPVCGASMGDFEMVPVVSDASVAVPSLTADTKAAPLVIIGAGMAAYALAREFRKLDSATPLVIVTRDGGGYYTKPALSNALANRMSPADLVSKTVEQMTKELQADDASADRGGQHRPGRPATRACRWQPAAVRSPGHCLGCRSVAFSGAQEMVPTRYSRSMIWMIIGAFTQASKTHGQWPSSVPG